MSNMFHMGTPVKGLMPYAKDTARQSYVENQDLPTSNL